MSIALIIVIVLALFAVVNFAVKARTGSFLITQISWRGKSRQGASGHADGCDNAEAVAPAGAWGETACAATGQAPPRWPETGQPGAGTAGAARE